MFLTRSKTISAISNEQRIDNKESEDCQPFPMIPAELISVFEDTASAIESSIKQILPEDAQQLLLNMMSAWIAHSRSNQPKHSSKPVNKPSQPTFFRSWTTRSFMIRSKSAITPFSQQAEILNVVSVEKMQQLTSSSPKRLLTGDQTTGNAIQRYQAIAAQGTHEANLSCLPSLVSDQPSPSFVEETLTPLSAISIRENMDGVATSDEETSEGLPSSSETNNITSHYSRDIQPVRRSLSSIFTHLGHSVKKAFRKKARTNSLDHLKKTFSVQQGLSAHQESEGPSLLHKNVKRSFSSFIMEKDQIPSGNEEDDMQSMSDAQTSRYDEEAETPSQEMNHMLCDSEFGTFTKNYSHFSTSENNDNSNRHTALLKLEDKQHSAMPTLYWDEDSTQSQQFNRLLDDIWETSQEYQDYFAAEQRQQQQLKVDSSHKMIRASRTEGNMDRINDAVPYVCVGKDSRRNSVIGRVSPQLSSKKLLNIEDIKAYKRSMSVYSKIQDYDLKWQASFHEEQKSRDKVAKTLKSVSWAFYNMVKHNHKMSEFYCDEIFDENGASMSDLSEYQHYAEPLTEWNDIYDQLAYVFDCGELTSEHAIITFVYVQRMLSISDQKLWDFSWRMIIMSSLLTAVKVWDDCAIFNADFAMIFPELSLDVINTIERVFLRYLEWDVSVSCSDFARTYFHLRQIEHMMDQW